MVVSQDQQTRGVLAREIADIDWTLDFPAYIDKINSQLRRSSYATYELLRGRVYSHVIPRQTYIEVKIVLKFATGEFPLASYDHRSFWEAMEAETATQLLESAKDRLNQLQNTYLTALDPTLLLSNAVEAGFSREIIECRGTPSVQKPHIKSTRLEVVAWTDESGDIHFDHWIYNSTTKPKYEEIPHVKASFIISGKDREFSFCQAEVHSPKLVRVLPDYDQEFTEESLNDLFDRVFKKA